jgi:ribose transport system ATP-binding protein
MGFEEVPALVYGSTRARGGQVTALGKAFQAAQLSPELTRQAGMVLVPANRLRHAIVVELSVGDNVTLPVLTRHFRQFRLRLGELRAAAFDALKRFGVRPSDPDRKMGSLSGGNQQKCVLAKWLQTNPHILLLHEPTQGVDVGARQDIYRIIRQVAESGASVLLASSEQDDLESTCSRVLIFKDGRIARQLSGDRVTADDILEASFTAASGMRP